jgi:hypothetical protein
VPTSWRRAVLGAASCTSKYLLFLIPCAAAILLTALCTVAVTAALAVHCFHPMTSRAGEGHSMTGSSSMSQLLHKVLVSCCQRISWKLSRTHAVSQVHLLSPHGSLWWTNRHNECLVMTVHLLLAVSRESNIICQVMVTLHSCHTAPCGALYDTLCVSCLVHCPVLAVLLPQVAHAACVVLQRLLHSQASGSSWSCST